MKCSQDEYVYILRFFFQCFGDLNNVRKLYATPERSYLNLLPEEAGFRPGNMFCACHAHQHDDG